MTFPPHTGMQARLVESLQDSARFGPECDRVQVIETHISYVFLTGQHAYKIKKAVNLGFLDFTSLPARRFYCEQELRLNRRLAPTIYLNVVPITGSPEQPQIGGGGPVIEYAVKMREFPQDALLTYRLARGELSREEIDPLAATIAAFHRDAAVDCASAFGTPDEVRALADENFLDLAPLVDDPVDRARLERLRRWTEREHAARSTLIAERRRNGFIRECHGDLHLGNIATVDGAPIVFDCIEFNDRMRWSDVMSDVAFLVMDLQAGKRPDLAFRFLNRYLEQTGDYAGVGVLRFYIVYRALVRAKVARLRAAQTTDRTAKSASIADYRDHVELALAATRDGRAAVVITHGPTGSGKTTLSEALVELVGAVRIRTDVERKRLHGLGPEARSGSGLQSGLYTPAESERTYLRVRGLARAVVAAGYTAIADGTFLARAQRDLLRTLAGDLGVPFVIVDFVAKMQTMRDRVGMRLQQRSDASEADETVLEHQVVNQDLIATDERQLAVSYDAEAPLEEARQSTRWRGLLERLGLEEHAAGLPVSTFERCTMDDYGRRIVVDMPFERTVMAVSRALRDENLHIIGRVDVRDHLKDTLGHEFRRYVLLQACSSQAMLDVLLEDLAAGAALPVTVAVYELADGETAIVAGEPLGQVASDLAWRAALPRLASIADRESRRLARALDRIYRVPSATAA